MNTELSYLLDVLQHNRSSEPLTTHKLIEYINDSFSKAEAHQQEIDDATEPWH